MKKKEEQIPGVTVKFREIKGAAFPESECHSSIVEKPEGGARVVVVVVVVPDHQQQDPERVTMG